MEPAPRLILQESAFDSRFIDAGNAFLQCTSFLDGPHRRLLADSGIDKYERFANAFNDQWAVRCVRGNKEIAGVVDLSDLVTQQHFSIRVEVEEIFAIAPNEEYPLVMSV